MPILGTMAYIWHRCLLRRSRAADDEYEMDGGEVREFGGGRAGGGWDDALRSRAWRQRVRGGGVAAGQGV